MKKTILLPAGFLVSLSEKTRKEIEQKAYEFSNIDYITDSELYSVSNLHHSNYHAQMQQNSYRETPKVLASFTNEFHKVEFSGIVFSEFTADYKKEHLLSLQDKAKELDTLKKSLSNIKTAIGDVK